MSAPGAGAAPASRAAPVPRSAPAARVALVHHWLVSRRGGERVLAELSALAPGSTLFTLVHDSAACPAPPGVARVVTSRLQHLPAAARTFRAALPLHATAWRALDLSGHDVVLSSDAALAKTVRVPAGARHLCYCYSPPRWAWDLAELYLRSVPAPARPAVRALLSGVRAADREGASGVTRFLAISEHVRGRIERCYGRESQVIHPPVDTGFFVPDPKLPLRAGNPRVQPFLVLGEAVPYKRFEVAIAACRARGARLVVAGSGRRLAELRARHRHADPSLLAFAADPDDAAVRRLYQTCRALLFPGEEDFGLVPVEAMACDRPVIALARGGATETVVDGVTGCLYAARAELHDEAAEVDALVAALERFESEVEPRIRPGDARAQAERFSAARFRREMAAALDGLAAS
jgi:glycosyltransferase involved in cell wall biosynthesis